MAAPSSCQCCGKHPGGCRGTAGGVGWGQGFLRKADHREERADRLNLLPQKRIQITPENSRCRDVGPPSARSRYVPVRCIWMLSGVFFPCPWESVAATDGRIPFHRAPARPTRPTPRLSRGYKLTNAASRAMLLASGWFWPRCPGRTAASICRAASETEPSRRPGRQMRRWTVRERTRSGRIRRGAARTWRRSCEYEESRTEGMAFPEKRRGQQRPERGCHSRNAMAMEVRA